ncbi:MAG: hypothetical protein V1809_05615 [Planctomycetota bacterium]
MELIVERGIMEKTLVEPLMREAGELTAIMASSRKSASRSKGIFQGRT